MKICLAFYPIDDMGGIINHNEQLAAGLQILGHETDTVLFMPREDRPRNGKAGGTSQYSPYNKMRYDLRSGYTWPLGHCIPYRGRAREEAVAFLNRYDLIIWQVAVPTKRKENRGNTDWLYLYHDTTSPQLAVIHDGNFLSSYPWLYAVREKLAGLACVHDCAFNSAQNISIPNALIYNPFDVDTAMPIRAEDFRRRRRGFLSVQVFKALKRVPELLRAVPHTKGIECHLAGKGIDYYYLTSKDKCKYPGVWEDARKAGLIYHGVITNEERDRILRTLTCLVDNSWSKKYADAGGHFNRVAVEALMQGVVPIVRPLGIGDVKMFQAWETCLVIPQDLCPEDHGDYLSDYCNLSLTAYMKIMANRDQLLSQFSRTKVAGQFLKLALGASDREPTSTTRSVVVNSSKALQEFFNAN